MTSNRPLPFDEPGPGEAPRAGPAPPRVPGGENLPESTEMTLNEWLANLWGGRYIILACVALAMLCSAYYLHVYVPIYRVDAMVQIEAYKRSMMDKALADMDSALGGQAEAQTELEILSLSNTFRNMSLAASWASSLSPRILIAEPTTRFQYF